MDVEALLREASDPTTPGQRLQDIWDATLQSPPGVGHNVRLALGGNPNLPLEQLRRMMGAGVHAAWLNPSASLVLLSEPIEEYERIAARMLLVASLPRGTRIPDDLPPVSLASRLGELSRGVVPVLKLPTGVVRGRLTPEVQTLAGRLAGLFGLPWPGQAAAE